MELLILQGQCAGRKGCGKGVNLICGIKKVTAGAKACLYFQQFTERDPPTGWVPRSCPGYKAFLIRGRSGFFRSL
jgi:hypothetical protein